MSAISRSPVHLVLLIVDQADNDLTTDPLPATSRDDMLLREFITVAERDGITFLTFCQPAGAADISSPSQTLHNLSDQLQRDRAWLRENSITVHFAGESDAPAARLDSRLHISLISQCDGRAAIVNAVQSLARKIEQQQILGNVITANLIGEQLSPMDLPDPDLFIFTGGHKNFANSLLWQSAYAELAFIDDFWPQFSADHLERILDDYRHRDRRFGGLSPIDQRAASG